MRHTVSPAARRDLNEIAERLAQDSPHRALKVVRALRAEFAAIVRNPRSYRLRPEIGEDLRLAVLGHHVILFWIDGKLVRFERVVYGGRDLPALFVDL